MITPEQIERFEDWIRTDYERAAGRSGEFAEVEAGALGHVLWLLNVATDGAYGNPDTREGGK